MGLAQTIKGHYGNKNRPENLRQIVLPGIGTGIGALMAVAGNNPLFGAWADIALLAAVTRDTLIVGVLMDTPGAAVVWTVDIGSCAGYAAAVNLNAVPAAVIAAHRVSVRMQMNTDAGTILPVMLEFPIWIPSGVGILGRTYTVAGGQTCRISVLCIQGFE